MIFLQLFLVFSKIGIVGFGGGYAMLSLIQDDVVNKHGWLSSAEFTDIVAVSQMTPGPLGINMATYVGYTSVLNAGYPTELAMLGSLLATLSILWLPFILMIVVSRFLLKHKESPIIKSIFAGLRPTIVGLVAAAALVLMNAENFGAPRTALLQFVVSLILFALAFISVYRFKVSPLKILALAGIFGMVFYSVFPS
ncbi:chromate transport protein [Porphyromonas sp. oral taxon 278 str. W7784]|uniref:chromate transporter n=1 Tax=Porphyromonas sp. oral taxon 278 TaxID=712437 RepID=UPI0003AD5848|nr:chromate transporter [Porphyromonas sp. oral taxon 278]ERJ69673.1 chromate transport protein [Porphyromonas sp. oral taxon 278 str. W7784]